MTPIEKSNINIISYNLYHNNASKDLAHLAEEYSVDIFCLQEADSSELPEKIGNLKIAGSTDKNRLDLVIYYNPTKFRLVGTKAFVLERSAHDLIMSPSNQRLLAAKLISKDSDKPLVIASFHGAPLTDINRKRKRQIREAHTVLREFGGDDPTIMTGDYNYPFFKKNLEKVIGLQGYEMALSDKFTYARALPGRYDFVTYSDAIVTDVLTLPKGLSDHRPILIKATDL